MFQNINEKLKDLRTFLQEAKLESKELDIEDLLASHNPDDPGENKLYFKKYKDALYIGELNETQQRHGRGIMIYHTGRRFEG